MKHVIFASYGNDSVALIQWAKDQELEEVVVLYNQTGWASEDWETRATDCERWVESLGFENSRTKSIGMEALVKKKKGWPRQGMQFCTYELKILPTATWMQEKDPRKLAICLVGVRREESANRANFPELEKASENYGGRDVWAPLVDYTETDRDELLGRAGITPLPTRSMECFPCINSNRTDLRELAKDATRIEEIAKIEDDMGFTANGKPRTMFRPYRHMGATGIREIVKWAVADRGAYTPTGEHDQGEEDLDDGTGGGGCNNAWCGI